MNQSNSVNFRAIKHRALDVGRQGVDLLGAADVLSPDALHKLRTTKKRLRSLWKFAEPETGRKNGKTARRRLRVSAKMLSEERDLKVMGDTLRHLENYANSAEVQESISRVGDALSRHSAVVEQKNSERMKQLANAFSEDLKEWESLAPDSNGTSLDSRLARTYGRAYGLAQESWETGDIKIFHKWRRWTKCLMYQFEVLEIDSSTWLRTHFADLKELGRELGLRHDLHVLGSFINDSKGLRAEDKRRLTGLIEVADADAVRQCRGLSDFLFLLTPPEYKIRVKEELAQCAF